MAGKRQKTSKARPAAAAAKTCGPALSAIEKALEPADKTFNVVEKILATRLSTGVKQYLILGAEGEGADQRGSLGAYVDGSRRTWRGGGYSGEYSE